MILSFMEEHPRIEKPTAQVYYKKLIEESGIDCTWNTLRCKVRYLKNTWQKATAFVNSTGSVDDDEGARTVEEKIRRMCPHYDRLQTIFGSSRDGEVVVVETLEYDGVLDFDGYLSIEANEVESPPVETSELDEQTHQETPSYSGRLKRRRAPIAMEKLAKLETDRMEFRERKLQFDHEKFEWSKELKKMKLCSANEMESRKLALEERKLMLEEQKLKNDFELRKLELELKYNQK